MQNRARYSAAFSTLTMPESNSVAVRSAVTRMPATPAAPDLSPPASRYYSLILALMAAIIEICPNHGVIGCSGGPACFQVHVANATNGGQ
jgi:hypothetical protein